MKLLHVIPSMNPRGGGPMEGVVQMARIHLSKGVNVEVVSFDEPDAEYLARLPMKVNGLGRGFLKYGYNRKLVPWLNENVKKFDVVIINGIWQYHAFGAWRVLRNSKIPYFVYTHGMLDPWFKKNYPLKHLKKCLYWPWADYRVLRDAKAVLFTCEEESILAPKSFGLWSENSRVVKYGAATPPQDSERVRAIFLRKFPELENSRNLLFLSRIHEKKGCDIIIEAFSRIAGLEPKLRLIMAGPDQNNLIVGLKKLAEKLGVSDKIVWAGMLQGDLKWGAFYSSELFVLPSHQENFGIAVAESLGCGVPVLISDKVNIWREILTDASGLVGNDDVTDTEVNMRKWLLMPIEKREEMGRNARATFYDRFTIEQMTGSLIEVISELVKLKTVINNI
jgi:glycosyltransferase involved in cell wall biosynthesis